jgi:hypothetical protein
MARLIRVEDRRLLSPASGPSLKGDINDAGANWLERKVVVDRGRRRARKPDDLAPIASK